MYPPEKGLDEALSLLYKSFGSPQVAVQVVLDSVCKGETISNTELGLESFYSDLVNCKVVLEASGAQNVLDAVSTPERVFMRLPHKLQEAFAKLALERGFEVDVVPFNLFIEFIEQRRRLLSSRFGRLLQPARGKVFPSSKSNLKSVANVVQGSNENAKLAGNNGRLASKRADRAACSFCDVKGHSIFRCEMFLQKPKSERLQAVKLKRLCFNCLSGGHVVKDCASQVRCRDCAKKHHTLLHLSENCGVKKEESAKGKLEAPATVGAPTSSVASTSMSKKVGTRLQVIPVCVINNVTGMCKETFCLLDSGADCHLIDQQLSSALALTGRPMRSEIQMANGEFERLDTYCVEFGIRGISGKEVFTLENARVVPRLPDLSGSIPSAEDVARNQHLAGIDIPTVSGDSKVQVIVGIDSPGLHIFSEIRQDGDFRLWAGKSPLGWVLHGRDLAATEQSHHSVNLLIDSQATLALDAQCPCQFDYVDRACDPEVLFPSLDDEKAADSMKRSCTFVDGHHQIGIPWKQGCPDFPNNFGMALSRLKSLGRRLGTDPVLFSQYKDKIHEMFEKGYAVEVPATSTTESNRVWYVPHHCVTSKFRIVFDCAAQFGGTSLNGQILQGPDNNLVGVVTRFRKHAVAVVGDVRAMFMQVQVDPTDQPSLRFLWWDDDDIRKPPKEYQLTVHCFGLTSSPSVAGFALRRTAEENRSQSSAETVRVVYKNVYVDDVLVSVADSESAVALVGDLDALLGSAVFELAKLSSNRHEVLEALPSDRLASCLTEICLYEDELPGHKALGLIWLPHTDVFGVKVAELSHPCTRRGLLSLIMSFFDPLGMLSPFLLSLKVLLQRLTKSGLGWDAEIPEDDRLAWEKVLRALPKLGSVSISRCFEGLTQSTENQLHVFADASNAGIGAVCYLRTCCDGVYCVSFIMGKSRVAPLKSLSTPRMELSSAVIAVRLARFVQRELDVDLSKTVFWSDSTTVLGYLRNTAKRRPIFETNRIKLIHELSSPDQWKWIDTRRNPADLYSRGVSPSQVNKATQWLQGPSFLLEPEDTWSSSELPDNSAVAEDNVLVQPSLHVVTSCTLENASKFASNEGALERLTTRFSNLSLAVRVTAWLLRLKRSLRERITGASSVNENPAAEKDCITASEYDTALLALISLSQRQQFPGLVEALELHPYHDIASGRHGQELKKLLKPLVKYCPFVEQGVMRIGGRLQRSSEPYDVKHPIVLPRTGRVTALIVTHFHQKVGHNPASYVINELRERYFVVGQERTVKVIIKNECMACRNRRAKPSSQIMSPLPAVRVKPGQRLFTATGVDFMGPILVKCNRNTLKRYCCLFTCLASRATHLAVAYDLTTNSFLMALRRFLAVRGTSTEIIYCDNATNFIGAEAELKRGLARLKRKELCEYLSPRGIKFRHSPPLASHQGGVWEAIIRLVRKAMAALMSDRYFRVLTDEGLCTLLKEIEYILNCRPLTRVSADPDDFRALTPMTLLNGCMASDLPMDVFVNSDGLRASYRATQLQADLFWQRWRPEYLSMLQKRHMYHSVILFPIL